MTRLLRCVGLFWGGGLCFFSWIGGQDRGGGADSLVSGYERGLNTDGWIMGMVIRRTYGEDVAFTWEDRLSSSRLTLGPSENRWKDENRLSAVLTKRVHPSLFLKLEGTQFLFSDKQSGFENDIRTQALGLGAEFHPRRFRFPVGVGLKNDRRFGHTDQGLTAYGGAELPFQTAGYEQHFRGRYEVDRLDPRRNEKTTLEHRITRRFFFDTEDSLRVFWEDSRRDYYISGAGEIESRGEHQRGVENILRYRITERLACRVDTRILDRRLGVDVLNGPQAGPRRRRQDYRLETSFLLLWQMGIGAGSLFFTRSQSEERYERLERIGSSPYMGSGATPDNQSLSTLLVARQALRPFPSDTVVFIGSLQRHRYDTPDPANHDDRDELRIRFELQSRHRISPTIAFRTGLSLHLTHLVYIHGDKSGDNNWTRILRLGPALVWNPSPRIRWVQSVEVLANYVAYDFEHLLPGIRSFVYRKFQADDTLRLSFTPRMGLFIQYRLEKDENGKFLYDRWLEERISDRTSHTVNAAFLFRFGSGFTVDPGMTFFSRRGYRDARDRYGKEGRRLDSALASGGPFLRIRYGGRRLKASLLANRLQTRILGGRHQGYTRIDCRMSWRL